MLYDKRAALTTRQIVILTILIVSFVIILFLLFRLNLQGTSEEQICHSSVVQRGSSVLSITGAVPLNCKTKYICISATAKCDNPRMPNPDEIVTVKGEEQIYKVLTEEMANCWWMYGEGELDYLGERDWSENFYCSLCAQFLFDDSVNKIVPSGKLKEVELFNYMISHEYSSERSYYEYIKGQKIEGKIPSNVIGKANTEKEGEVIVNFREFDISKSNYAIVMAIASKQHPIKSIIAGVVGGALIVAGVIVIIPTLGIGTPLGIGLIAGGGAILGGTGYLIGTFIEGGSGNKYVTPTILELGSEDYKALNCVDIKTLS